MSKSSVASGRPRPKPAVPEHLQRSRRSRTALALADRSEVRDDLVGALQPARAALWLIDQLHYGELGFLDIDRKAPPPCWASTEACDTMDATALRDWLEDLALRGLARALGDLVTLINPDAAEAEAVAARKVG